MLQIILLRAVLLVVLCSAIATAQQPTTQPRLPDPKFDRILPTRGDIGLGLGLSPFLQYFGQLFTPDNPAPTFNNATGLELSARYFLSPTTAIRGRLRLGYNSTTTGFQAIDVADSSRLNYVEDEMRHRFTNIVIGGGIEKRRGYGRLQGLYGGELLIGFEEAKSTFEYGNALTGPDAVTASTNFGTTLGPSRFITSLGYEGRVTEYRQAPLIRFGIAGFLGAEYFFAPKLSIGGEFGWSIFLASGGGITSQGEAWNSSTGQAGYTYTRICS
jgi:hypothetical protein